MTDACQTELCTEDTLDKKSVAMGKDIGVQDIVVVLDLAIYAKAVEVRWHQQEDLSRIVIRPGAFHTACTFIAVTAKRFKCSKFEDILIESDVVASGSIKGVIEEQALQESRKCTQDC